MPQLQQTGTKTGNIDASGRYQDVMRRKPDVEKILGGRWQVAECTSYASSVDLSTNLACILKVAGDTALSM